MERVDGEPAYENLAAAVLAATPSAVLPAAVAEVAEVTVQDDRLHIALAIGGRDYRYRWPENGSLQEAIISAPAGTGAETWATTVIANLAELLEAADRGLVWALGRGLIEPEPER
jgi:hypothetical protein